MHSATETISGMSSCRTLMIARSLRLSAFESVTKAKSSSVSLSSSARKRKMFAIDLEGLSCCSLCCERWVYDYGRNYGFRYKKFISKSAWKPAPLDGAEDKESCLLQRGGLRANTPCPLAGESQAVRACLWLWPSRRQGPSPDRRRVHFDKVKKACRASSNVPTSQVF